MSLEKKKITLKTGIRTTFWAYIIINTNNDSIIIIAAKTSLSVRKITPPPPQMPESVTGTTKTIKIIIYKQAFKRLCQSTAGDLG